MEFTMRTVITTAVLLTLGMMTTPSFAECSCVTSKKDSGSIVGEIVHSRGEVLYSGKFGFAQATSGSKLVSGSQISTGPGASASISVGKDCALDLPQNSEASVLTLENKDAEKPKVTDLTDEDFDVISLNVDAEDTNLEEVVENNICLEVTSQYSQVLPALVISQLIPVSITAGNTGIILAVSGGDNSVSN